MKTIYNHYRLKILVLILISTVSTNFVDAQINVPGDAVWQWSTPVRGAYSGFGKPVAYLWIPENCTKLRGLVVAQNNMEELSVLENKQFRDSMASIGFGEIWFSPAFSPYFNVQEGAGQLLENTLLDLSESTGYPEMFYVPLVGIGHSAMANFPFSLMTFSPERALCGVSISAVFPYDYGNDYARPTNCGSTIDYMPYLVCQGEMEGAGDLSNQIFAKSFYKRKNHPLTPITHLPAAGEWHFATSQKKTNFIAYYIKKAASYRLTNDATSSSFASLAPINPTTTGWLYDRWVKNMRPRYLAAPVSLYKGKKSNTGTAGEENFWAFDEDMARKIEAYEMSHFRKTPCLIAYNQSTTPGLVGEQVPQNNNHVQCRLQFYPLNDSLDFELSSSFLNKIPAISGRCANFMGTTPDTVTGTWVQGTVGATIGYPVDNSLSEIDRELGPIAKLSKDPVTGITKFRMVMERGNGSANNVFNPVFSVSHPGDATYKASVLQADMWFNVRNTSGTSQTISFPLIDNVSDVTKKVNLNASSSSGLPVQYYIEEGPARISGNKIIFTNLPQNSKLPVKVTVVAWQWGRNSDMVTRLGGNLFQSAEPIKNTFFIIGRLTPKVVPQLTGKRISAAQSQVDWELSTLENTERFELEKSMDNVNWVKLTDAGTVPGTLVYAYTDNQIDNQEIYYRVKSVSADGTFIYSEVLVVNSEITENVEISSQIEIRKINDNIQVSNLESGSNVKIIMYDSAGKMILQEERIVPDNGIIKTYIANIQQGVFVFNIISDKINQSTCFVN